MDGKRVQFAGGGRESEAAVTGLSREIRVDTDLKTLRVHDGIKQGGHVLATEDFVMQSLLTSSDSQAAEVQIYSTQAEIKAAQPSLSVLAIVREEGRESSFVWSATSNDVGDIASDIQGYWKRLDSQAGTAIQLWRSGMIDLQIGGTTPAANQDTTAWLTNDLIRLYDGTSYEPATPTLWMRLFAKKGGYTTVGFTLPDRLGEIAVGVASLDSLTLSGWHGATAATTGAPSPSNMVVEHREFSAAFATQIAYVHNDPAKGSYIRYRTSNSPVTWTTWTYVGELPNRLKASQVTTAYDDMVESGFYRHADGSSVVVIRFDANNLAQLRINLADPNRIATRLRTAGVWGSWVGNSFDTHTHDDRYYTEAETDSLLAGKAAAVHTHDDRYYTEAEITSILTGYVQASSGYAVGAVYLGSGPPGAGNWANRGTVYESGPGGGYYIYLWQRYS